ncbi:MAG TPA: DUF6766 family protein [Chryseolinea sp.]|nr:DUF6766 family protein [Chryseolinea sp.]
MKKTHSFLYKNSLTIVLLLFFALSLIGQIFSGLQEYNDEREEYGRDPVAVGKYLTTGHFIQTTFENWESEFLQMGMYVLLTIGLRQIGSSESKKMDKKEEVDREPDPKKAGAPWPVKKGGWILALYKHSLSLAFIILFLLSFWLHAVGSLEHYNEEQLFKGKATLEMNEFIGQSRFWFESFQNWQSEFIAVVSIVCLSIYFRQKGSPESKPVDASFEETGSS